MDSQPQQVPNSICSLQIGSLKHTIIPIRPFIEPQEKLFECQICLEDCLESKSFCSSICQHSFCSLCIQEYIKEKINIQDVLAITCPQEECSVILSSQALKNLLDAKAFELYETITLKKIAAKNSKGKLCQAPGCALIVPLSSKKGNVKCKCGELMCNTCGSRAHKGKSCLEAIDSNFMLYSSDHDIKFCMVCKTTVKRTEGCKHITCPICDYEWCWDCGRQFIGHHPEYCPRVWDPTPPNKELQGNWRDIWTKKSKSAKIMFAVLCIFLLPVLLPVLILGGLLLWPIFYFNQHDELRWNQPSQCVAPVLCSMLIGVIFAPVIILCVLLFGSLLVVLSPCIIVKYGCKAFSSQKGSGEQNPREVKQRENSRWRDGNPDLFKYTSKGKPIDNAPSQVQSTSIQINDQITQEHLTSKMQETKTEGVGSLNVLIDIDQGRQYEDSQN